MKNLFMFCRVAESTTKIVESLCSGHTFHAVVFDCEKSMISCLTNVSFIGFNNVYIVYQFFRLITLGASWISLSIVSHNV